MADPDEIGKMFVNHYYNTFDTNRTALAGLYTAQSCLSFEGVKCQGADAIMEKLRTLPFQQVKHVVTTIDVQPTIDSGIMVMVMGQLKTDNDHPHGYSQIFYLKQDPTTNSFVLLNDIFRLNLHNG